MKIAVITLHRVRNYGSVLQTLAYQRFLEQNGCEAEIIDYYPERYTSLGLWKRLKHKSICLERHPLLLFCARMIISVSYLRKKIVFDRFLKRNIHLTPVLCRNEAELKKNLPEADGYCTGSDQVWNSHWNEGIDTPLYLSFLPEDAYRFSYAASIGSTRMAESEKRAVLPMLERYRHITVREDSGVSVIAELGLQSRQMPDPVLLFTAEEWGESVSERYKNQQYIAVYNLHHDGRIDQYARRLAAKHGLKIYNISYNLHDIVRSGRLKWCPRVEEYLGLIRDAQYVVTDSFHAAAFSVLFHTSFLVIYPEHASSRIRSLLSLLNMEERGQENLPATEKIEEKIDFSHADMILEQERNRAVEYLRMVLTEIKERVIS